MVGLRCIIVKSFILTVPTGEMDLIGLQLGVLFL